MSPDPDEISTTEVAVARGGVQAFSAAALRRQRSRRGLSLRQLSLLASVSAATINSWEKGNTAPSPRPLAAVAAALGVDVADLVPVAEDRLVLADLRHQIGLSQHAAADAVGLTASMYGAVETGFRTADPEQRHRLAALYGVTEEKFQVLWQRTRDTRMARLKVR